MEYQRLASDGQNLKFESSDEEVLEHSYSAGGQQDSVTYSILRYLDAIA